MVTQLGKYPHRNGLIFAVFIIVASLFHTYNLDFSSYDLDEAVHIWHAQKSYSEVVEQASNDPNPPVYNLIISTWVKTFGVSEYATRFFSVIMGVIGVLLMYIIAARNFGMAVGILAALLYCFSPIQFRFTHLARPYSMLMVTVLLSYGMLFECLKKQSAITLISYMLLTAIMIYVHPTSVFNLAAQGLIVLIHFRKRILDSLPVLLAMVGSAASFAIWMLSIPYFDRNDDMWFAAPNWSDIWYVITVFYGSDWVCYAHLAILAMVGLQFVFNREKKPNEVWKVFFWLLVPFVVSVVFSHLIKPVFQDKYILSVQPALMLLIAISIVSIRSALARIAIAMVMLALIISAVRFEPYAEGDWKNAVTYVKDTRQPNGKIFVDPWYEFRTLSYYYDKHMFETPDSTIKLLAFDGVHFAWHDVYENGQAKCDFLYVLSCHEDVTESLVDYALLDTVAVLLEERTFTGVKLRSYEFKRHTNSGEQEVEN
jgi:hypothetical protein